MEVAEEAREASRGSGSQEREQRGHGQDGRDRQSPPSTLGHLPW